MTRFFLLAAVVLQLVAVSLQQGDDTLNIKIRLGASSIAKLNDQINLEYQATYLYDAMHSYFEQPSVGLLGFAKFFHKAADEEREHAHKLMHYVNKRGGQVQLKAVRPEPVLKWPTALDAVKRTLQLEKEIAIAYYNIRDKADLEKDIHLVDFIESGFLSQDKDEIAKLRELIAKLQRAGSGLGEYTVDRDLLGSSV